jgi:hypothetical protein
MSIRAIARLIQTMLYGRRFFPYYVYNILGGIEEDGEPSLSFALLFVYLWWFGDFIVSCGIKELLFFQKEEKIAFLFRYVVPIGPLLDKTLFGHPRSFFVRSLTSMYPRHRRCVLF